jgi:hypothetical protein
MGRSASRSRDGAASNGKDKGGDGKRDLALGISGFHGRFMVGLLGDSMVIKWLLMAINPIQQGMRSVWKPPIFHMFHQNRYWYGIVQFGKPGSI